MILNVEKLRKNYKTLDKHIRDIWKNEYFSKGKYSGYGGDIYKLIQPINYDDFYIRQQEYAVNNIHIPIAKRGLTKDELINLASQLKTFCEKKINDLHYKLQNYIDYITYVNYIQTFDGKKGELNIVNWLNTHGFNAELTNKTIDSNYGIDIIYNKIYGIQLKSHLFLISNKQSVLNDIKDLKEKYKKALNELNVNTFYAFFDKNENKFISFKNNKILTDFNTIKKVLDMNINERKKYISKLKRMNLS